MKTRFFSILVVLSLLVSIVPATSAQDGDELICFNLPADDCALLLAATANSENAQSFSLDYTVDISLTGIGTLGTMMGEGTGGGGDTAINITGSGVYMADPTAFPPAAIETTFDATMSGTENESDTINVIVVDGFIYNTNTETETWEGRSIAEMMNSPEVAGLLGTFMGSGDASDLPGGALDPGSLLGGNMSSMLEGVGDLTTLLEIPGFIDHVRDANVEMMGQEVAVFKLNVDMAPLFASAQFQSLMTNALSAAAAEDPDVASAGMLLPMLLAGTSITVVETQYVGLDDNFIHGMGLDLVANLDMSALMGASASTEMELPPIVLEINFMVTLDQINETFDIAAPADAVIISDME